MGRKKFLASAFTVLALSAPAFAGELDDFARLPWNQKVKMVVAAGGEYRRDCSAVMSGQRGIKTCLHITEATSANGSILAVRAGMDGSFHQWCVGSSATGKMVCVSQETGASTTFILLDGVWHSVN